VRILILAFILLMQTPLAAIICTGIIAWRIRRRAREERWAAYIRNECALYIEEVLGVA
jgi:hypothetical protein